MNKITIQAGSVSMQAELNDNPTALQIWETLPIEGQANLWGDEIYFSIPVDADQDADARADVDVGELGYWPMGSAFCIFFGPTPVSRNDRPRAASPVNIIGYVVGDATQFRKVKSGARVILSRADE
jgi:hypothetical protein